MVPTLIIDPDLARQAQYRQILARGFALQIVGGMAEAVPLLSSTRVALLIVCATLPDGNGIELAKDARTLAGGRAMKILLCGEDLNHEILGRDTARKMGADDLMQLPLDAQVFKHKLKTLLVELKTERDGLTPVPQAKRAAVKSAPAPMPAPEPIEPDAGIDLAVELPGLGSEHIERLGHANLRYLLTVFKQLESLDYYRLLGLARDANPGLIRKSYYKLSRQWHPDRFKLVPNPALGRVVSEVFKRISEAHRVLRDPKARQAYDGLLLEGDELRLKENARKSEGPASEEAQIKNPQAKKFFKLAMTALSDGDRAGAKMNFQLARSMDPGNPIIQKHIDELESPAT